MNPLLKADFPDADVIRVEDTFYMASTTMHFMPGCVILRSYNLKDWEIVTHVYDELERTHKECLAHKENAYGQGMWAPSFRYHDGKFYICFVANDTRKTYLFQSDSIYGPWEKSEIKGFYHDCSLLFDDDGKVYLAYGNTQIYVTELKADLSGPKPDGLHKMVVEDTSDFRLGYEGTHFYKINGKYYLFFIHWPKEEGSMRTQACYVADRIEGPYIGGDVLSDDRGYCNQGVAQGGIVDTPDGDWYSILFQDSGAIGRIPVLVPVTWEKDYPIFGVDGKVPNTMKLKDYRPGYSYESIYGDDDFAYTPDENGKITLHPRWEWNHIPKNELWSVQENALKITTGKLCNNPTGARNTLTQRFMYPGSDVSVRVDGTEIEEGDIAGLCLLQGDYKMVGLTIEEGEYYIVLLEREDEVSGQLVSETDTTQPQIVEKWKWNQAYMEVRVVAEFTNKKDTAQYYIKVDGEWKTFGKTLPMYFKLDHFCGCRGGLCYFSTKKYGGKAYFSQYRHSIIKEK